MSRVPVVFLGAICIVVFRVESLSQAFTCVFALQAGRADRGIPQEVPPACPRMLPAVVLLYVLSGCWCLAAGADYLQKYSFPSLRGFFSDGVLVDELTNVFVTKTFPNHYSLVTGLHAESHGVVHSNMYDPASGRTFSPRNDSDPFWWNEATPIWVTAQEAGLRTAAAMWPGTEYRIQNRTSTHFLRYDPAVPFQERLANVTGWLLRDEGVRFAALYWEEPDRSGHAHGPDNVTAMTPVLREVDRLCSQDRLIRLDDCLDRRNYTAINLTPVATIIPLSDKRLVYDALSRCHANMKAYLKEEIPDRLHYRNNERIQPIILVADEGWTIVQSGNLTRNGDHGYDNSLPSMHPFLAAHGPDFRRGYRLAGMHSVDVYPLMCWLLGLPERPNNGSLSHARCLLAAETCLSVAQVVGIVLGTLLVLTTLTCLVSILKNRVSAQPRPFTRLALQDDDADDPLIG
ncbi:hypothetical protein AAFF_G00236130 [Aldrovandia affinis]|uniref:bis(5'-adenosyl)-triphosphatase n=1 Tax=Aldrovandia affinis TaxID=143900 RepID=A0AAD7REF8_9TELE|nr:hypothetical protein AAFF_G00236130 [Aldrovandia affinis]